MRIRQSIWEFYNKYFSRHQQQVSSKVQFHSLADEASVVKNIPYCKEIFIMLPFLLSFPIIFAPQIVESDFSYLRWFVIIFVEVAITAYSGYWFDRNYWKMISESSEAFKEKNEYFRKLGMVTRLIYDSFPFIGRKSKRLIHLPTLGMNLIIILVLLYYSMISELVGVERFSLLWYHFILLTEYFLFFLILVLWTLLLSLYFLAYDLATTDTLSLRFDFSEYSSSFGLEPFSRFLIQAVSISTINLLILTILLVWSGGSIGFSVLVILQALISLVPFFAYQYGFHSIMLNGKRRKLEEFRRDYGELLNSCLNPVQKRPDIEEVRTAIEIKKEIERAPEWPTDVGTIARIVTLVLLPVLINLTLIFIGLR